MPEELALPLIRVVEEAALASARTMGQGDRKGSDRAAVPRLATLASSRRVSLD
jgi:fructose-1,6-bisphosphatase/sedoheptulose 1,7-bisphosphatase-like protein